MVSSLIVQSKISLPSNLLTVRVEFVTRPTRVGNHPATVLDTFGCWPRFWVCLNMFDLSDVVNIKCIVQYGIEINIHTYIHTVVPLLVATLNRCHSL